MKFAVLGNVIYLAFDLWLPSTSIIKDLIVFRWSPKSTVLATYSRISVYIKCKSEPMYTLCVHENVNNFCDSKTSLSMDVGKKHT